MIKRIVSDLYFCLIIWLLGICWGDKNTIFFLDKLSSLKSSGLLVSLPQWTLAKLNVLTFYKVVFVLERAFFLDVGSAVNHWANLGQFPLFSVQWEMRCAFIGQKWCYIYVAALGGKAAEFSSSVPIAWRGAGAAYP